MVTLEFKRGISFIFPLFDVSLCLLIETTPFSLSSPITSQGEDHDLLVYTIASPTPPPAPVSIKPSITLVYFWRQNPPTSSLTLAASSSDPVQNDDLLIALRKGKRQCAYPISSFVSYNRLSSSRCSFIASLDSISHPNTVREALSHSGWRSVMVEEMQALMTMVLGTWYSYLLGRKPLNAVGFFCS